MSARAMNLAVICAAIDQHNANCKAGPAVEVKLSHFEYDRLGWDEVKGIPIRPDAGLGSGRFRIVCASESDRSVDHDLAAVA